MRYGYVENKKVIEIRNNIPNTNNISNIQNDIKLANSLGWYEVIDTKPVLKDYETLIDISYEFDDIDKVINTTYNIKSDTLEEYKIKKIDMLKTYISELIYSKYPTYKQVNASLNIYSQTVCDEIKIFINDNIAYCDEKEVLINNLNTLDEVESFNFYKDNIVTEV